MPNPKYSFARDEKSRKQDRKYFFGEISPVALKIPTCISNENKHILWLGSMAIQVVRKGKSFRNKSRCVKSWEAIASIKIFPICYNLLSFCPSFFHSFLLSFVLARRSTSSTKGLSHILCFPKRDIWKERNQLQNRFNWSDPVPTNLFKWAETLLQNIFKWVDFF